MIMIMMMTTTKASDQSQEPALELELLLTFRGRSDLAPRQGGGTILSP